MGGGATEWEDILIDQGIINAPPVNTINREEIVYNILGNHAKDGDSSEDILEDDDVFFSKYRNQRLEELKKGSRVSDGPFGSVIELSRPDFINQVTEGSKSHWVVVHLYQDAVEECQLIKQSLQKLATKHKNVKFVQIQATRCIENYSDGLVPTILVYKNGTVFSNVVKAKKEQLEALVNKITTLAKDDNE